MLVILIIFYLIVKFWCKTVKDDICTSTFPFRDSTALDTVSNTHSFILL